MKVLHHDLVKLGIESRGPVLPAIPAAFKAQPINRKPGLAQSLGMTDAEVAALKEQLCFQQGNRCAICTREFDRRVRPHLDHCHATNVVRAVLCSHCNHMLGFARDNARVLRRGADYVEEHS